MTAVFEEDLEVDQGADFAFTSLPYLQPNGTPYDFTNATARMMARPTVDDSEVLVSITTTAGADGLITLNGIAGTASIAIAKTATSALDVGTARYDLLVDFPSGKTIKLLSGRLLVGLSATR